MKEMEEKNIFMYIPDITGYTELITMWDSPESRIFVERILNAIVNNNKLKLEVSDIMGDAVFFYSTKIIPSIEQLIDQTSCIHKEVIDIMRDLEDKIIDHNLKDMKECIRNLGLKFIAHLGPGLISDIDSHKQIIGKAVIESYKLLKNSIPLSDYLLMSDAYFEKASLKTELNFLSGKDNFDHVGEISYKIYGF